MALPAAAPTALFKYRLLSAEQLRQYEEQGYLVMPAVLT